MILWVVSMRTTRKCEANIPKLHQHNAREAERRALWSLVWCHAAVLNFRS